ncbi:hypothetical protein FQA39_LY15428 [Lamprigera yunnana]|nr:hypothetical protein FQA39_LY15428 [Lamprigera yunnana]
MDFTLKEQISAYKVHHTYENESDDSDGASDFDEWHSKNKPQAVRLEEYNIIKIEAFKTLSKKDTKWSFNQRNTGTDITIKNEKCVNKNDTLYNKKNQTYVPNRNFKMVKSSSETQLTQPKMVMTKVQNKVPDKKTNINLKSSRSNISTPKLPEVESSLCTAPISTQKKNEHLQMQKLQQLPKGKENFKRECLTLADFMNGTIIDPSQNVENRQRMRQCWSKAMTTVQNKVSGKKTNTNLKSSQSSVSTPKLPETGSAFCTAPISTQKKNEHFQIQKLQQLHKEKQNLKIPHVRECLTLADFMNGTIINSSQNVGNRQRTRRSQSQVGRLNTKSIAK